MYRDFIPFLGKWVRIHAGHLSPSPERERYMSGRLWVLNFDGFHNESRFTTGYPPVELFVVNALLFFNSFRIF